MVLSSMSHSSRSNYLNGGMVTLAGHHFSDLPIEDFLMVYLINDKAHRPDIRSLGLVESQ